MSIYVVTGKLGSGKTLLAVSRIRDALRKGKRVATNLDLKLEAIGNRKNKTAEVLRVPDKPTVRDLDILGMGADVLDEEKYGLLVLDELAAWLNARQWNDKERQSVIEWLVHSRKKRWDVIFIVQHINMIDKQIREALAEYVVTCKRLDKVRIPFFGRVGQILTLGLWDGKVGKVHMGVVVYAAGSSPQSPLVVDRWFYRGHDLYGAYDTEQVFTSNEAYVYRYLPAWYTHGRYDPPTPLEQFLLWLKGKPYKPAPAPKPEKIRPLLALPPDVRWQAARQLVSRGLL